jgi:hypothetical protein
MHEEHRNLLNSDQGRTESVNDLVDRDDKRVVRSSFEEEELGKWERIRAATARD